MDPITLLIIGAGGATAAGVAAAVGPLWRQLKLRQARDLISRPVIGAQSGSDAPRSVSDVYRDLGSNEYAIEVMRHMDLIPETEQDLEIVASSLTDAITSFGTYDQLVESLKETIGELSEDEGRDHKEILERRLTLSAPRQTDALLPAVDRPTLQGLPEGEKVKQLEEDASSAQSSSGADAASLEKKAAQVANQASELEPRLHATVDDALTDLFGTSRSPHAGSLEGGAGGVAAIVVGGVLGSLTTGGGFWEGVSKFVPRRRIKQMRSRMNSELSGLSLDLFHAPPQVSEHVDRNIGLMVQEKRWEVERRRREAARLRQLPRKQRSPAQQALTLLASQEARVGLNQAERDAKKLKAQITRHRRSGRHDLAGFLIYVNRKDLFQGVENFNVRILAIEEAGDQLRQALLAEVPGTLQGDAGQPAALPGPGQPLGPGQPGPGQPGSPPK